METTLVLSIASVALIGPLAGMSLDQLLKQLPARRHIGNSAYSAYMRAADLRGGIFLYVFFGAGAALATVVAAIGGYLSGLNWRIDAASRCLCLARDYAFSHYGRCCSNCVQPAEICVNG